MGQREVNGWTKSETKGEGTVTLVRPPGSEQVQQGARGGARERE